MGRRKIRRAYASLEDYFEKTGEAAMAFAARLGISNSFLSEIRSGKRQPSLGLAIRMAEAANVPIESLLMANAPEGRS